MIKHLLQTPRVRLDAISDGIFAIAMTIMVLEIKLPETHDTVSQPQLLESMSALLPTLLAFFISFTLLANLWASHSRLPSAELLSRKTVEYNFHFLLFVCLMPFPTALLNRIGFVPLAAILFSINLAAAMLALARLRSHMLKETDAPAAVRKFSASALLYAPHAA